MLQVNDADLLTDVDRSSGTADSAWMLLQTYLCRHGDSSSRYHRCIAAKLLQHGFTLPSWLTAAYKVLSAGEKSCLHCIYIVLTVVICNMLIDSGMSFASWSESEASSC